MSTPCKPKLNSSLGLKQLTLVYRIIVYFFITVKAVLGSNEEAISASNGFYLDTTPPTFDTDVFIYIDVRQGDFTPVWFQGSNSTIKAIWLCEDDRNEIKVLKLD